MYISLVFDYLSWDPEQFLIVLYIFFAVLCFYCCSVCWGQFFSLLMMIVPADIYLTVMAFLISKAAHKENCWWALMPCFSADKKKKLKNLLLVYSALQDLQKHIQPSNSIITHILYRDTEQTKKTYTFHSLAQKKNIKNLYIWKSQSSSSAPDIH